MTLHFNYMEMQSFWHAIHICNHIWIVFFYPKLTIYTHFYQGFQIPNYCHFSASNNHICCSMKVLSRFFLYAQFLLYDHLLVIFPSHGTCNPIFLPFCLNVWNINFFPVPLCGSAFMRSFRFSIVSAIFPYHSLYFRSMNWYIKKFVHSKSSISA